MASLLQVILTAAAGVKFGIKLSYLLLFLNPPHSTGQSTERRKYDSARNSSHAMVAFDQALARTDEPPICIAKDSNKIEPYHLRGMDGRSPPVSPGAYMPVMVLNDSRPLPRAEKLDPSLSSLLDNLPTEDSECLQINIMPTRWTTIYTRSTKTVTSYRCTATEASSLASKDSFNARLPPPIGSPCGLDGRPSLPTASTCGIGENLSVPPLSTCRLHERPSTSAIPTCRLNESPSSLPTLTCSLDERLPSSAVSTCALDERPPPVVKEYVQELPEVNDVVSLLQMRFRPVQGTTG